MAVELNLGKIKKTDAELKADVQDIVGEMGGSGGGFDILWTNQNSLTANFLAQTIPIENILQYRFYEVLANGKNIAYKNIVSTGKVPINAATVLFYDEGTTGVKREINAPTEAGISVAGGVRMNHSSTSHGTANNCLVPYMVLGYK